MAAAALPDAQAIEVDSVDGARTSATPPWSDVLRVRDPSLRDPKASRELAALAEKGNEALWDTLAGQTVARWTPSDNNSLTRLLSSYLRRSSNSSLPVSLVMVSTMPMMNGFNNVTNIT
ncbi:unnamed protein product, partial [Prorocentrum cordatum]